MSGTWQGYGTGRTWVAERTPAWLPNCRRLKVCYERRVEIHQAFLAIDCALDCFDYIKRLCRDSKDSSRRSLRKSAIARRIDRELKKRLRLPEIPVSSGSVGAEKVVFAGSKLSGLDSVSYRGGETGPGAVLSNHHWVGATIVCASEFTARKACLSILRIASEIIPRWW